MSKAFTIHSAYHEINGDYLEYDIRDYGEAGIKKCYRNEKNNLFLFYNKFHRAWWIHDEYNAVLRTKEKSVYNGLGIIHAIGYLSNDMHGQWHYSGENLQNNTGPIHNVDKSIPNGYILSNKDKYTILCNNNGCYEIPLEKKYETCCTDSTSNTLHKEINKIYSF